MNSTANIFTSARILSKYNLRPNVRQLYSRSALGVEDYEKNRKNDVKHHPSEKFRERMNTYADSNNNDHNCIIFTEDLKLMVHTAQPTIEDLTLVEKMMIKFHKQNSDLRFGSYHFGPVVMRMYHYLNKPEEALKVYNNRQLEGFFDQLSSVTVLMDLLFRNEKYSDIIELYKTYRNNQIGFGKHPRSVMVLLFASCYKLNTPEIFDYATQIWKEMTESGLVPLRRITCFMAALALNQNNPHISIEILSTIPNQYYVLVRSLKALSYCAIGRVEDVIPILTTVLTFDVPYVQKPTFPCDVIESIKKSIEEHGDKNVKFEFDRIEKQFHEQGHINNESLSSMLTSEMLTLAPPKNSNRSILNAAFNNERNRRNITFRRPGLKEMG